MLWELQVRTLVQQALNKALDQYDLLLSPVAPTTAFRIGEKTQDPLAMYKEDLMTVHLNLAGKLVCLLNSSKDLLMFGMLSSHSQATSFNPAGLPGISIPCGEDSDSKMPVGLQLIAPAFGEVELLKSAHVFEQSMPSN